MNARDEQSQVNLEYHSELNYFPPQKVLAQTRKNSQEGNGMQYWYDVSKINYWVPEHLDLIKSRQSSSRGRSIGLTGKDFFSMHYFMRKSDTDSIFDEEIPLHVTSLMNEGQLWGCFYNFPELYADGYAPVVRIRKPEDVAEIVDGILTRDVVTTCLSYLKRTPILGDFVYIKLNLSGKHLINIDILQHYKYLVYLDLSSNLLTDLSVLSYLLYLQFVSVAFNRLSTVLEYSTPQWFLTEVHYKYNSVKKIRDLDMFWSITILDLSHNNIKSITGLNKLRYLRHLDLSFNHIQRLENLSHLRLLWLDVSYNNISSFEFGSSVGLSTLLHLEYLNLNENNLKSMRIFTGCTRLRELHIRNNRLSILLELAVYMRQMRRLIVLDMRANPICSSPGYKQVVFNTFPLLLSLDATELDPVDQRSYKMDTLPDLNTFACRRLLRMLYVEQLARGKVSPHVPPADTTEVPIVVIVGYEAVGKGTLARRLASECESKIALAIQHTTSEFHNPEYYKVVSRRQFDDMLVDGELLTYSEIDGESYGLSRQEAFITDGKVRLCTMDLISALMLKQRGRRPYLILASFQNKKTLAAKQLDRKMARATAHDKRWSAEAPFERSTLQVLLSGRIIITGILNEIILSLPDNKEESEFVIESACSLLMDSEARQAAHEAAREAARGLHPLTVVTSSSPSLDDLVKQSRERGSQMDTSLYSLYKESQDTSIIGHHSYDISTKKPRKEIEDATKSNHRNEKGSNVSRPKSYDFSKFTYSAKSSKSVTFTSQDNPDLEGQQIEPPLEGKTRDNTPEKKNVQSISTKLNTVPWPTRNPNVHETSPDDLDLWLAFLMETGLLQASDMTLSNPINMSFGDNSAVTIIISKSYLNVGSNSCWSPDDQSNLLRFYVIGLFPPPVVDLTELSRHNTKFDDPESIIRQMGYYDKTETETVTSNLRDDYEGIHRLYPGLFHDTVTMDDPEEAFRKTKKIIRDIVNNQSHLLPMFDIDFANLENYPTVEKRLDSIRQQIAPRQLFY